MKIVLNNENHLYLPNLYIRSEFETESRATCCSSFIWHTHMKTSSWYVFICITLQKIKHFLLYKVQVYSKGLTGIPSYWNSITMEGENVIKIIIEGVTNSIKNLGRIPLQILPIILLINLITSDQELNLDLTQIFHLSFGFIAILKFCIRRNSSIRLIWYPSQVI